ncbi:hypothetical protein Tco_1280014 [Tanacetum coccineum]
MVHQLTKFHVQRVDMVINPPWNLPFIGAKGLTSPEQTATGVNTPGSDENRLKLYDLMYKIVKEEMMVQQDLNQVVEIPLVIVDEQLVFHMVIDEELVLDEQLLPDMIDDE